MTREEQLNGIDKLLDNLRDRGFIKFQGIGALDGKKVVREAIVDAIGLDEFIIKDTILDNECKLNGAILISDEYYDFVRQQAKALSQSKDIIKIEVK